MFRQLLLITTLLSSLCTVAFAEGDTPGRMTHRQPARNAARAPLALESVRARPRVTPQGPRKRLAQRIRQRAAGGKKLLVLSFAGGGLKGALSVEVAAAIEARVRQQTGDASFRLRDHVAAVAGTSTGALIAAGFAEGKSWKALRESYQAGARVFPRRKLRRLFSLFQAKHSNRGLKAMIKEQFGDSKKLGELELPVVIPVLAFSTPKDGPGTGGMQGQFMQTVTMGTTHDSVAVAKVLAATTAAPTYLPEVANPAYGEDHLASDGGTFANDPTMHVAAAVKRAARQLNHNIVADRDISLLTIGTGQVSDAPRPSLLRRIRRKLFDGRGALSWLAERPNLLDATMGATADSTHWMAYNMFGRSYQRVDPVLPDKVSMDDPRIVPKLQAYARSNAQIKQRVEDTANWLIDQLGLKRRPAKQATPSSAR